MNRRTSSFLLAVLLGVSFLFVSPPSPSCAQKVEVEVNTGPKFDGNTGKINGCIDLFRSKFPFDYYSLPNGFSSAGAVPSFGAWGFSFEFPWILDIWSVVHPGFLIYLFYTAIIRL